MPDRTILVLGTNAGQADLIRHMKTRGWRVESCSNRTGDIGEADSDVFHAVDIRDRSAVCELASKINADVVYSVSSDLAMGTAIWVSEQLTLPHFYDTEFFDLLAQKPKLRAFLNARSLSVVPYKKVHSIDDVSDWDLFPCMVKPSDSQGQRGVVRIDQSADLLPAVVDALAHSMESHSAIIEGFLEGVEISCNTLVRDGQITIDVLSERLVHQGFEAGIPRGHLVPCANVSEKSQAMALELVHDVIHALGTRDGTLYFQIIVTPDGPKIVEIAPRLDGCHMWRLIKVATGQDYLAAAVDTLVGEKSVTLDSENVGGDVMFELMFQQTKPNTPFQRENFAPPFDAIHHEFRYTDGDAISPINGKLEVVGYYIRKCHANDHLTKKSPQS